MTPQSSSNIDWFVKARYGLFIHFGLYSLLGRGEWAMNKEEIPPEKYRKLADQFRPDGFDADEIADLAMAGGMRYLVFTTMHHEGFRMYDSDRTDFCSTKTAAQRNFTAEIVKAARERGLKIGLYHSLNNWFDQPDAVDALENGEAYESFISNTLGRVKELVTRFNPIDILWYDGWWPFDAAGWRAKEMNDLVRAIQPHILFNGRNCLPGDFATPEQHLSAPSPWRPWEACVTLNDNWGFHRGDHNWKSPVEIVKMLARVAQGKGNLLLNVGPDGTGSIPRESIRLIRQVGNWLKINGECIFDTDFCTFNLLTKGEHRGDWSHHGSITFKGNVLYLIITSFPVDGLVLTGLNAKAQEISRLDGENLRFEQKDGRLSVPSVGTIPAPGELPFVLRIRCDRPPEIYKTGGLRTPACAHPRYDPVRSDIAL